MLQISDLNNTLQQFGIASQRDQNTISVLQEQATQIESAWAGLYDQLLVLQESFKCEKESHALTKETLAKQWQTFKQLSALIAPNSPEYRELEALLAEKRRWFGSSNKLFETMENQQRGRRH